MASFPAEHPYESWAQTWCTTASSFLERIGRISGYCGTVRANPGSRRLTQIPSRARTGPVHRDDRCRTPPRQRRHPPSGRLRRNGRRPRVSRWYYPQDRWRLEPRLGRREHQKPQKCAPERRRAREWQRPHCNGSLHGESHTSAPTRALAHLRSFCRSTRAAGCSRTAYFFAGAV